MDEILTVREVAKYLKLSRTTVWRWCNEGKLHAFKVGRGWRIHRSEVEEIVGQSLGAMKNNLVEERKGQHRLYT
jgi:excisionase family DNA binding protein